MVAREPTRRWVRWDPSGRPDVPVPPPGGQSVTEVDSGSRAAGPSPAQVRLEDPAVVRAWAAGASAALRRERAAIDRVNVFPVADADTGTNLSLTLREGELAVRAAPEGATGAQLLAALARAALLGARGNSGVILSEWLRGLACAGAGSWLPAVQPCQ
ncbi:DAK2 domain-containing protein, partial [Promicromonospora citrea]|nr:DAK2 domain-containing protein [Promicromonospora citrea]